MTPAEFSAFVLEVVERHKEVKVRIELMPPAVQDRQSDNADADILAEALFLRVFARYEADVERIFLHYVTGGASLSGIQAETYLRVQDETRARQLIRGGYRFLSWAKPSSVCEVSKTYLAKGWPVVDMLAGKTQELSDCEKIRNRIAHHSIESAMEFAAVQRNLFYTERVFAISPGQLLRTRYRGQRVLVMQHYTELLRLTIEALADPSE